MAADPEWLITGLGNPGEAYEYTAHNLGFLVVDRLALRHSIRLTRKESMALVGQGTVGGRGVILAKPQTFMNVSGASVQGLMVKYGIKTARLLLIFDDLDLPWETLRIRPNGSAGGHNGVKSVIASAGSEEFPRLKLGIHGGHRERDGAHIVLSPLKKDQRAKLDELLDLTSEAVEFIIAEGVEKAMTRYNSPRQKR